jgi:hypothetical protein
MISKLLNNRDVQCLLGAIAFVAVGFMPMIIYFAFVMKP